MRLTPFYSFLLEGTIQEFQVTLVIWYHTRFR